MGGRRADRCRRGRCRRPRLTAYLIGWAGKYRRYVEGRCLLAGVDMDEITFRQFLCVVEALTVETLAGGMGDRSEILETLHTIPVEDAMTEETWGTSTTAQASQRAMIGVVR